MPVFRYLAADSDGHEEKGTLEAETARDVRALLRERGLMALKVEDIARRGGWSSPRGIRLADGELVLITRQFAALIGAGISVEGALDAIIDQASTVNASNILANVRKEVRSGFSLADAIARQSDTFPSLYQALVRGGEESGSLPRVMDELANHLEARGNARQSLSLALLYPSAVMIVAILVVGGLMTYVVPQIAGVFAQTKQTLPALTRGLLAVTAFLRDYQLPLLGGIAAAIVAGVAAYRRSKAIRLKAQSAMVAFPVVGRLLKADAGAQFANTLSILLSGGVPMLRAMASAAQSARLELFRDAVERAADKVREGVSLARALSAEEVFPPLLIHFIDSGEKSGELAGLMQRASRLLQVELENRLRWLGGVIEPSLIVGMGAIVLVIVLAVLMPIIEINHLVR